MIVRNLVGELSDKSEREVDRERLRAFIVHRIDFSRDSGGGYWRGVFPVPRTELDGYKVSWRFTDNRKVPGEDRKRNSRGEPARIDYRDRPGSYTGGEIPYVFLIKYNGEADQMIPASHYAPHARRWSRSGIACAVAGDFRERDEPTQRQWGSLVEIAALFVSWIQRPVSECVLAHDELDGSSSTAAKECPGERLDMDKLREEVEAHSLSQLTRQQAEGYMLAVGIEL